MNVQEWSEAPFARSAAFSLSLFLTAAGATRWCE